jgi:hypothetical protein
MSWILTASGRKIALQELSAHDVYIDDIAAHLAKQCRFAGACRAFWSVAEHSVLVERILAHRYPDELELRLCGLLHDAPEYLLVDVPTPVKDIVGGLYRPLERTVWWAIAERFGLPQRLPREVEHADRVALATEKRDLMPEHPEPWSVLEGIEPDPDLRCGDPERHWQEGRRLFLETFHWINHARLKRAVRGAA